MKGKFQWKLELTINAPSDVVWSIANDVSLIPKYHPAVDSVDLIDGQRERIAGTRYQCNVTHGKGKGSCIEEVVESIPGSKVSTFMGKDSWGIDKLLKDFVVDTTLIPEPNNSTVLRFEAFYNPAGIINRILNLVILRRKTMQRSREVMHGIKRLAEKMAIGIEE
jgi:Polyketide cyclase / dehydrase and lipid transport